MAHKSLTGSNVDTGIRREFWIYEPTGRVRAVELRDDAIVGAAGPLDAGDVHTIILDYLEYFRYEGMWVNENRAQFMRIEPDAAA